MIIAERTLEYVVQDGQVFQVPVSLHSPEHNNKDWGCRYTIGWPNGVESQIAYGIDAVQALVLTLQTIGASLYASDYHKSGGLKWAEPNDGYGFPVPKTIRHLLIGYDSRFDA